MMGRGGRHHDPTSAHARLKKLLAEAELDESMLRDWLRAFSTEPPRWGWRRAHKQLRREGRQINAKRV